MNLKYVIVTFQELLLSEDQGILFWNCKENNENNKLLSSFDLEEFVPLNSFKVEGIPFAITPYV